MILRMEIYMKHNKFKIWLLSKITKKVSDCLSRCKNDEGALSVNLDKKMIRVVVNI